MVLKELCSNNLLVQAKSFDLFLSFLQAFVLYLISCSLHQTTKPQILFSSIFSANFCQLDQLKKKTNFLLVQNRFFLKFGPMKSLFSFSSPQTEKTSWKKLGKTRFMVWWFDVTNKILLLKVQVHEN
jgi:hypothetical protein